MSSSVGPYREPQESAQSSAADPTLQLGRSDDLVVLGVIFMAGAVAAASGLSERDGTTAAAIGLMMMVFALSGTLRQLWPRAAGALRKR